jgi:hypothetical protein
MRQRLMLVGAIVLRATLSSFAGWEYSTVTSAEGSQHSQRRNNQMTGWVDGDKAKIEFLQSDSPLTAAGSYLVTKDGGKIMYMVNPRTKTYSKWDIASIAGFAGGAMQMMNMKISAPKVETLLEEKGEKIAGFATTHYRFRTSYTAEMNFMGIRRATSTVTEEDIWACPELNDAGLTVWVNQQGVKTGNEQLDKLVQAEMEKVKGFPLKRIAVTTTKDGNGEPQVMKMTTQVTEIKKANPSASLFALPAGYQETPMLSPISGGKGGQPKSGASGENPFLKIMEQIQQKK